MTTSPREYRRVVLDLLPRQGELSEADYLWLTDRTNRLIEFADGAIAAPPIPTRSHQLLLKILLRRFEQAIEPGGGIVLFAPLRLRLRPGKFREPDLLLLLDATDSRNQERYWNGADLVLEIVSADQPERDLVEKRREYAEAGIPEYWIVDPLDQAIIVLTLDEHHYVEHGVFRPGMRATSALLAGFSLAVSDLFGPVQLPRGPERARLP